MDLVIPSSDMNIFSDYNKGIFNMPWFRKYFKNADSIVDPKHANIDLWEDCTVFKPNASEAKTLSDKKGWKDQVEFFTNSIRCKSVVITQSGEGVVGKDSDYFEYRPKQRTKKVSKCDWCWRLFCLLYVYGFIKRVYLATSL